MNSLLHLLYTQEFYRKIHHFKNMHESLSQDPSGVFSISTFHCCMCKQSVCLYNRKTSTWLLEGVIFIISRLKQYFSHWLHLLIKYNCFYHLKMKFISFRHCVLSSIYYTTWAFSRYSTHSDWLIPRALLSCNAHGLITGLKKPSKFEVSCLLCGF